LSDHILFGWSELKYPLASGYLEWNASLKRRRLNAFVRFNRQIL